LHIAGKDAVAHHKKCALKKTHKRAKKVHEKLAYVADF
jgi:hypothetical protein